MPSACLPLSAIRQAAFLYGPDLAVVETNDLAEALAGRPLAGCSAGDVARLFRARHADGTPLDPAELRSSRALAGEVLLDVPLSVTAADGRAIDVLATASPVRDGDAIAGVLVLWQDVTEQRAAERTNAEQHELLERLIETVPVMISIHDPALGRFHLNRAVEEILGYTDEDAADGRLLERTYPDPAYRASVEAYMRSLEPGWRDMTVTARNGSAVPTAWANFRLSNEVEVGVGIDLRERTAMEAALRESEAEARSFMENMIDAVAICETVVDTAGEPVDIRVIAVNPAFLHDLPLAEDEVVGRTASAILPAMDRRWFGRFLDVAQSGSPVTFEEPFPAFGRWYRVAAFRFRGGRVAVVFHDITEEREAEAALREYADLLREQDIRLNLALDAAAVGVFDWDPLTGAETWDDRIRQQWGIPPGAPVDHAVFEAGIRPEDRAAVAAAIRRALDPCGDGRYAARYRVVGLGDGVERRIASRGQVFFEDGRAVRMIGTTIDVTEQEQAEKAVRAHERLLQSLYRAAPVGIGLVSAIHPGRRFEQVNDHLLEMTGYARDELVGQETRILYTDDEAHTSVGEESAFQIELCGRGEIETRWRRKDGTVIDILLSSSPISQSDLTAGIIFTALDITDLSETERALMRYARDLRQSNEELQQFAYVASHDLQEPLRSIISFSQLLERRYRGQLGQDADEYIDFIVDGGNRMQQLIQDLLQVSRVETQAQEPVPTDPGAEVYAAARSLDEAMRGAGATVTVGDLPTVLADPAQLQQVFANLIGNAIKYRHPARSPAIAISAERMNGMVEFAVKDNGIGIEAEYFDRIFEMFRRLHTHDKYEGTGIGLAVVKRIIERHGGTIRVESTPGEGSTFYFTLPAHEGI